MSTDFSFYTKITLTQVKEETNIKIIEHNDNTFLQDSNGNKLVVNKGVFTKDDSDEIDEDTFDLTRYGDNNPKEIIDELVKKFDLKFLIDDDEQILFNGGVVDLDVYLNECSEKIWILIVRNFEIIVKYLGCCWYQVKLILKQFYQDDLREFTKKYKEFEDRMRPLVYELGFLRK